MSERELIVLGPGATRLVRNRSTLLGMPTYEYVRRCLGLAEMVLELDDGEDLMIRRCNGDLDRVRFVEALMAYRSEGKR